MELSQATIHALLATGTLLLFPVCILAVAMIGPNTKRLLEETARGRGID